MENTLLLWASDLLANGVLDHDGIGVDGVDDVGGANLRVEVLYVLVQGSFQILDPHLRRLPLPCPHPA